MRNIAKNSQIDNPSFVPDEVCYERETGKEPHSPIAYPSTTLPGFMMFFGSSARLSARIRSTSTADL